MVMGSGGNTLKNALELSEKYKKAVKDRYESQAQQAQANQSEFQKEQDLIQQAVQAGFGISDAYSSGAEKIQRGAQKQGTAMQQMAARSLMGATPFGQAGGALLPAAAGTGIQAAMNVGALETQAAKDTTAMRASGQDAMQAAAQFAISALPGKMAQNAAMGYLKTFYEVAAGQGLEEAQNTVNAMLAGETNPQVVAQVQNMMNAANA